MRTLYLALFLCLTPLLNAQSLTLEGCITDTDGEPLIGVNILVKGTKQGTVTDMEGCFELTVTDSLIQLELQYIGYRPEVVEGRAGADNHFQLYPSYSDMEEVVITSSAIPRRRDRKAAMRMEAGRISTFSRADADAYPAPAPPTEAAVVRVAPGDGNSRPDAGLLTAGEIHDFSKWQMWEDVGQEDLARYRDVWQHYADHRYTVQLTFTGGRPVINGEVVLRRGARGKVLWTARTDNTGKAELWAGFFDAQQREGTELQIEARYGGNTYTLQQITPFEQGINFLRIPAECEQPRAVDVAFVVDATGSMADEIAYLQAELLDVAHRAQEALKGADLRLGSVFYRDQGDDYLTRHLPLTSDLEKAVDFIKKQGADGGGDTPEAVDAGLETALNELGWRSSANARLLFLVLDASPHQDPATVARLQHLTRRAAERGIRIIPVSCSGIDKGTEYWLRTLALATNGTYTFLTDHSGIGNPHIEPSTDVYEVEKLNDLLFRLLLQYGRTVECEDPVAVQLLQDSTSLLPLKTAEPDWTCFPNPTRGPLTVELAVEEGQLFLADAQGKLLRRYEVRNRRMELDLRSWPAGHYILHLEDEKGEQRSSQRIVLASR